LRRLADLGIVTRARARAPTSPRSISATCSEIRLRIDPLAARLAAGAPRPRRPHAADAGLARMRATLDDAAEFSAAD